MSAKIYSIDGICDYNYYTTYEDAVAKLEGFVYQADEADFSNGKDENQSPRFVAPATLIFREQVAYIRRHTLSGKAVITTRQEIRAQQERVTMAALKALPEQAFGDLRDPETASRIRGIIERITDRPAVADSVFNQSDNRQYDERIFRQFLVRAFSLMGQRTDEEAIEAEERSIALS